MDKTEFWEKWEPVDWPPITPSKKTKQEFMNDLEAVIQARLDAVAPVLQMAFQLAEIERWNDRFPKVFGAMSKALEQK